MGVEGCECKWVYECIRACGGRGLLARCSPHAVFVQRPGEPVLAANAFCGWRVWPVADTRAPITFLFGMFIFVKCFIIFYELRITEIQGICPLTWFLARANKRILTRGDIPVCPSLGLHPRGISAPVGCSHWRRPSSHPAPG